LERIYEMEQKDEYIAKDGYVKQVYEL